MGSSSCAELLKGSWLSACSLGHVTCSLLSLWLSESCSRRVHRVCFSLPSSSFKLQTQHDCFFSFFFFSYGSQLPSGVTGQGWVMVEFYPQAPRDHSVRTQNLIKKVIKHHVTATWPGKPRGGFCHCTNFLVVSVYVWARVHKCLELRQIKYGATRE